METETEEPGEAPEVDMETECSEAMESEASELRRSHVSSSSFSSLGLPGCCGATRGASRLPPGAGGADPAAQSLAWHLSPPRCERGRIARTGPDGLFLLPPGQPRSVPAPLPESRAHSGSKRTRASGRRRRPRREPCPGAPHAPRGAGSPRLGLPRGRG